MFPERFSNLPAYPFARLRALLDSHSPGGSPLPMTIGEPTHAFPQWIIRIIKDHSAGFNSYPPNDGTPELRSAISASRPLDGRAKRVVVASRRRSRRGARALTVSAAIAFVGARQLCYAALGESCLAVGAAAERQRLASRALTAAASR